jgi:hypothetical protein
LPKPDRPSKLKRLPSTPEQTPDKTSSHSSEAHVLTGEPSAKPSDIPHTSKKKLEVDFEHKGGNVHLPVRIKIPKKLELPDEARKRSRRRAY